MWGVFVVRGESVSKPIMFVADTDDLYFLGVALMTRYRSKPLGL